MDSPPRKTKRLHGACAFQQEWLSDARFSCWITQSDDKCQAKCRICLSTFSVKNDGVKAVIQHSNGKKHKLLVQSKNTTSTISNFLIPPMHNFKEKVAAVELTKTYHAVKHGHSYNSSDCGNKLDSIIYHDSELASKVQLGRTKMEAITKNVLAPYSIETIVEKIKDQNSKFSISIDASNKGNRNFFPLVVTFFDDEDGVVNYLLDFYEEPDETSQSIVNSLTEAFKKLDLEISDIVSYSADNASVNYGRVCSVFQKLQQINPKILKANCNCHVLHNAVKFCMKLLSYDVESLVLKVFSEFSISAKRVEVLKECFAFVNQEYHAVLRHITVRWATLFPAVERLLLDWDAIKRYFREEGENECNKIIWSFVSNENNGLPECYIYFVHHLLNLFVKRIKILESEYITPPEIYDVMAAIKDDIESRRRDCFFGAKANHEMQKLNEVDRNKFRSEALVAYERAENYLKKWFDYENSPFKAFKNVNVEKVAPTFDNFVEASKAAGVEDKIDKDALYEEIRVLQITLEAIKDQASSSNTTFSWKNFLKAKVSPNLKLIIKTIMAVPCSNAYVERVFSHMNHLWSDSRNRLSADMVKAELCIRCNFSLSCHQMHAAVKTNKPLLEACISDKKYKFK